MIKIFIFVLLLPLSGTALGERFNFIDTEKQSDTLSMAASAFANATTGEVSISLTISSETNEISTASTSSTKSANTYQNVSTKIETYETYLETPTGMRAPLTSFESNENSEFSTSYSLIFKPINSRYLYQLTQLNGDLEPSYTLLLKLNTSSEHVKLPLAFSEKTYSAYLANHAIEPSLNLHLPDTENETFIQAQKEHLTSKLSKIFPETPYVRAAQDQHLINGLAFRWRMHEENRMTVVSLQFVNHNKKDITLDLDRIQLVLKEQPLLPQNDLSTLPQHLAKNIIPNSDNRRYTVRAGKRFSWKFIYNAPLISSEPVLNIEGIQVSNTPIYATKISFKAEDASYF